MKKQFDITDRLGGESELGDDKRHLGGYGGDVGSFLGKIRSVGGLVKKAVTAPTMLTRRLPFASKLPFAGGLPSFRGGQSFRGAIAARGMRGGKQKQHRAFDPALIEANTQAASTALTAAGINITSGSVWDKATFMQARQLLKPLTVSANGTTVPVSLKMFLSANKITVQRA